MWFKNLSIYKLTENFDLTPTELEDRLAALPFRPCAAHEPFSFGWTPPLGDSSSQRLHVVGHFIMICARKEEKVLPPAVVNELLQYKTGEAEEKQNRKLSRKEKTAIRDELVFDLLPKAFSFSRKWHAYIDVKDGWLIVDAASAKNAEDLLSLLRKCLGSLPVRPVQTLNRPSAVMSQWLSTQQTPDDIVIEDECELRAPEQEGGIVRCRRHDLTAPEIKSHLDNGKEAIRLALTWDDRLAFVLDESLAVKRLRFLDLIREQATENAAETEAERFDADFAVMTAELSRFLPRLAALFGGEAEAG